MKCETNTLKPHIVLCAPKKTGKTTLIERIMQETKAGAPSIPVYGFQTKRFAGSDGVNRIYMFPAGHVQTNSLPSDTCYLGSTCGLDEIGHMEKDARLFLQAIFDALDGDIPILASVRYTTADQAFSDSTAQSGSADYLERIKHHPRVRLYMLSEENRDAVYGEIRNAIFSDRKEGRDHEPL